MDCSLPGSCVHGDSPGKNTGVGCPPPGDLPNPVIELRSPALQADSLPYELPVWIGIPKLIAMYTLNVYKFYINMSIIPQ